MYTTSRALQIFYWHYTAGYVYELFSLGIVLFKLKLDIQELERYYQTNNTICLGNALTFQFHLISCLTSYINPLVVTKERSGNSGNTFYKIPKKSPGLLIL